MGEGEKKKTNIAKIELVLMKYFPYHPLARSLFFKAPLEVRCSHALKDWTKKSGRDAMPVPPRPCLWMLTHAVFLFLCTPRRRQRWDLRNESQSVLEPWCANYQGPWILPGRSLSRGPALPHQFRCANDLLFSYPCGLLGLLVAAVGSTLAEKYRDSNWMWVKRNPREPGMCSLPALALITR